jgi:hypothetical protein
MKSKKASFDRESLAHAIVSWATDTYLKTRPDGTSYYDFKWDEIRASVKGDAERKSIPEAEITAALEDAENDLHGILNSVGDMSKEAADDPNMPPSKKTGKPLPPNEREVWNEATKTWTVEKIASTLGAFFHNLKLFNCFHICFQGLRLSKSFISFCISFKIDKMLA